MITQRDFTLRLAFSKMANEEESFAPSWFASVPPSSCFAVDELNVSGAMAIKIKEPKLAYIMMLFLLNEVKSFDVRVTFPFTLDIDLGLLLHILIL